MDVIAAAQAELDRQHGLKVQKELLDAQNAAREKKEDAPPRPPPKHQKRSAQ